MMCNLVLWQIILRYVNVFMGDEKLMSEILLGCPCKSISRHKIGYFTGFEGGSDVKKKENVMDKKV